MKIKMVILFVFLSTFMCGQTLLDEPVAKFKNKKQLEKLYNTLGPLLIINKMVYQVPCDCFPCRNLGGDQEGRNLAGGSEGRNMAGGSEGRNMAGGSEGRNIAGGSEGRNMAGGSEGRNMAGGSEGRNMAGGSEGRNMAGGSEGRNMAGGSEGRNMAGGSEGRNMAGGSEGRNAAGETTRVYCTKFKNGMFKIENLNSNTKVKFYDGNKLIKVKNMTIIL